MKLARSLRRASAALTVLLVAAACSPATKEKEETPVAAESPAPAEPATATAPATAPTAPAAAEIVLEIKDASGKQLSGDVARGARVFRQCQTCHETKAGVNKVGPSLHAIIGRAAGTVPGFRYSNANKSSGITWTEQEMFTYLENPRTRIPGTTMSFVGIRDAQQRADVIAYMKENTQ